MGLADELKTLQEIHEKGKLTDQEYADAKAATLKKYQESVSTSPASKPLIRLRTAVLLMVLLLLIGLFWRYNAANKDAARMIATAVRAPITVIDEIQNLRANSSKAVAFTLGPPQNQHGNSGEIEFANYGMVGLAGVEPST